MATSTSRARAKGRKSTRSRATGPKADADRRYRVFVPGDIELKKKPPHPLYLPQPDDMCDNLTDEIDCDADNVELVTRDEGLARVVEFNRKVLAAWDDSNPEDHCWSMLLETDIELTGKYGAYSITIEQDLAGTENRPGDRKVCIVRPTQQEFRRFGIKAAQPDHLDRAEFGLAVFTPSGYVLLEHGLTIGDACRKKRRAFGACIVVDVLSPGDKLLKKLPKVSGVSHDSR